MSLLLGVLPVAAAPIDTTSTTGVDILTVPAPEVIFEYVDPETGEEVSAVIDAPYTPSTIKGDRIALNQAEGLIWPGIGYPQPIGDDFPAGWTFISIDDMNSDGDTVGSYLLGSEVRGFFRSESGQLVDVGEPPGLISDPASDPNFPWQ